ncbi:type II toxin-antitoxin system Phd/YefM family antitoxin [Burkholderia sp. BE17]|uniref:type II toxin-antitoxin system Phd/YefM family antitoxin n=1 Tax=Burkholderia sp. BE17 TaxID=2656644 RepID=UPI00128C34CC|nr:type II toxin-antitoxin system Phd/YefM family antitoxin [Burkholderia sp. BE17]MPV68772.1 prevent-host-death protein [Burkholderia sp. BE17]
MQSYDKRDVKTNLEQLIDAVVHTGEPFAITKGTKSLVKVVPADTHESVPLARIGFMKGQMRIPDDFDAMGDATVRQLFRGDA